MSESIKGSLRIDLHNKLHTEALDTVIRVNVHGPVVDAELLAIKANEVMDILQRSK